MRNLLSIYKNKLVYRLANILYQELVKKKKEVLESNFELSNTFYDEKRYSYIWQ